MLNRKLGKVATSDFETDPFELDQIPEVFSWGFYDGDEYTDFWGKTQDECLDKLFEHLDSLTVPHTIYFHNGGRFDFFFFLKRLRSDLRVVNGRILQAFYGIHEFRDSYAAIPVPLSSYRKDDIDYRKLHKSVRHKHKPEILSYQKTDCVALYEMITGYIDEFGDVLTIGSASMKQFKKFHVVKNGGKDFDAKFRPYYFGGRNQCFKAGVMEDGPYNIYDINSQYPYSMKTFRHPVSTVHEVDTRIGKNTFFATIEGYSDGALPVRTDYGLDFRPHRGVFTATIHEINAGLDTGTLRIQRIHKTYNFPESLSFEQFVDHFYSQRMKAKAADDKLRIIFYKLVLNSAYGKFAQDPENYYEWCITAADDAPEDLWIENDVGQKVMQWEPAEECFDYIIWKKPSTHHAYYNVATAASITGAARSLLLRGIAASDHPVYCDTDSIICRSLDATINENALGAWKHEGTGDKIAIAGKKMYAVWDGAKCIKQACKGAKISPDQILNAAQGDRIRWESEVPKFRLDGSTMFVKRSVTNTARV